MADVPPPRLKATKHIFNSACKHLDPSAGGWTYVHDWQFHEIYYDPKTQSEYVIWYCTRCREVRHDPNGAPSY